MNQFELVRSYYVIQSERNDFIALYLLKFAARWSLNDRDLLWMTFQDLNVKLKIFEWQMDISNWGKQPFLLSFLLIIGFYSKSQYFCH